MSDGIPLSCGDCGASFQLAPDGSVQNAACSECGGKRFMRSQPSPTPNDMDVSMGMKNMVDSDSQKDQGGNPLGEGTIMGNDGERPRGKRDNFMHGKVGSPLDDIAALRPNLSEYQQHQIDEILLHEGTQSALNYVRQFNQKEPYTPNTEQTPYLYQGSSRTVNSHLEPYAPLWDESYVKQAQQPMPDQMPGQNSLTPQGLSSIAGPLMQGVMGGGGTSGVNEPQPQEGTGPPEMVPQHTAPQGTGTPPPIMSHTDIPALLAGAWDGARGEVHDVDTQHDDPEKQDQKEFNDGDKSPKNPQNPNNDDSGMDGEDGVRDATEGYGFGENSPGIERMMMLLPMLLHYYQSDQSGQDDPLMRGLHEALEAENPGYMDNDSPDGHNAVKLIIEQHKKPQGVHAGSATAKTATQIGPQTPEQKAAVIQVLIKQDRVHEIPNVELHPEQYAKELDEVQGGTGTVAPLVDPSQPNPSPLPPMPQAPGAMPVPDPTQSGGGMGQPMQPMSHIERILAALPQLPEGDWSEQDRGLYAKVLLQNHERGEHDQEAHPDCLVCNRLNSPDYQQTEYGYSPEHGRLHQLSKTADANNNVPRCPECGSATTSVDQVGDNSGDGTPLHRARCHACGHIWKIVSEKESRVILTELANPMLEQGQDQSQNRQDVHQDLHQQDQGDQLTWQDEQGNPIEVGQTYELHAPGFDVPDEVQVVSKKPNELGLKLVGEMATIHSDDNTPDFVVSAQELQSRQYSFVPSQGPTDGQPEGGLGGMPGLEQIPQSGDTTDEAKSSYPNQGTVAAWGDPSGQYDPERSKAMERGRGLGNSCHFCGNPMSVRKRKGQPWSTCSDCGMDTQGNDSRAPGYPNQADTEVTAAAATLVANDDHCHRCGGNWVDHHYASATKMMHECARCGAAWESEVEDQTHEGSADLKWVFDSDDDLSASPERLEQMRTHAKGSRSLASVAQNDQRLQAVREVLSHNKESRTAGRHFTPKEKRALINEQGTARNLDDLDLSHTHYEARVGLKAKPDVVPPEHLIFAL